MDIQAIQFNKILNNVKTCGDFSEAIYLRGLNHIYNDLKRTKNNKEQEYTNAEITDAFHKKLLALCPNDKQYQKEFPKAYNETIGTLK